jgi:hypothetical protein
MPICSVPTSPPSSSPVDAGASEQTSSAVGELFEVCMKSWLGLRFMCSR